MKSLVKILVLLTILSCSNKNDRKVVATHQNNSSDVKTNEVKIDYKDSIDNSKTSEGLIDSSGLVNDLMFQKKLIKENPEKVEQLLNDIKIDSINDKSVTFYLTHPKIAKNVKSFCSGEILPRDDRITFDLLDTLTIVNSELSPYYKFLFAYIGSTSDGALSEAMCSYSLQGLTNNTKLYLDTYIPNRQFLAMEFYYAQSDDFLKSIMTELKQNTDSSYYERIDELECELKDEIKILIEENN